MTKIFCKNDVRFMMQIKIAKWVVFVIEAELSIATILKCNIFMRRNIYYFLPDSLPIFLNICYLINLDFFKGLKNFYFNMSSQVINERKLPLWHFQNLAACKQHSLLNKVRNLWKCFWVGFTEKQIIYVR